MKVQIYTAGNGDQFGLVSLDGSGQVVVFRRDGETWRGCCEFNTYESTGITPGEATPYVAGELDKAAAA